MYEGKNPKPLVSRITNTCSSKYLMNARTHLEDKMKMPDYFCHIFLQNLLSLGLLGLSSNPREFYSPFMSSRLTLFFRAPKEKLFGLAIKDWGKEGIEYLSFSSSFVTMFSPTCNKGWRKNLNVRVLFTLGSQTSCESK